MAHGLGAALWVGLCGGVWGFMFLWGGLVGLFLVLLQARESRSNADAVRNAGRRLLPRGDPSRYPVPAPLQRSAEEMDGGKIPQMGNS